MLKKTVFNIVTSLLYTFLSTILSIFTTHIIINTLGSELNGIYQTSNQFINFFSIIEGGFVLSAVVSLYGPLSQNDYPRINVIYSTVCRYLRRTGILFLVASTLASVVYVGFIDTDYSKMNIFLLFFLSAMNLAATLTFQLKYSVLFEASQSEYGMKIIHISVNALMLIIILIFYKRDLINLVLIKAILLGGTLLNIALIGILKQKKFPLVRQVKDYDYSIIQGSKDIFAQKIAATINQSLDMVLLTAMSLPIYSSIYSIYNMMFNFAKIVGDSLCFAANNGIGKIYAKDDKSYIQKIYELYETNLYFCYSVIFLGVCAIGKAFIRLYIDESSIYIDNRLLYSFGLLFFLNSMNKPAGAMLNLSGNYAFQKKTILMSTGINLVLSVLLIQGYHIYGVITGTIISYIFLIPVNIYYNSKYVINRSIFVSLGKLLSHCIMFAVLLYFVVQFEFSSASYFQLLLQAALIGVLCILVCFFFEMLVYGKVFRRNFALLRSIFKGFVYNKKND